MKFISKNREATFVIRPARVRVSDGFREPIKGERVNFHYSQFDTDDRRSLRETFPYMEPGEEEEKKKWLEKWLFDHPKYGTEIYCTEDKEAVKKASEPAHPYQCPYCKFEGKNDTSLKMHTRRMHAEMVIREPKMNEIDERVQHAQTGSGV